MAFFDKLKSRLNGDWCKFCSVQMEESRRKLFAIPSMTVGHYVDHENADYYLKKLVPVSKKADIPTGMYACGIIEYRCPKCGKTVVKVCPFLPVRDAEKNEFVHIYENGELDSLFNRTV
ncbi:MAG: hypothetical protein K2G60_05835 [Oscillospiraceae bacterium]|nr:hypothetical protein [Oscillospiraceae bacterium]